MANPAAAPTRSLTALLQATLKAVVLLPAEERLAIRAGLEDLDRRVGAEVGEDRLSVREIVGRADRLAAAAMEGLRRYPGHPELAGLLAELEAGRAALRSTWAIGKRK